MSSTIFRESYLKPAAEADPAAIEAAFDALEQEALERLAHEGVAPTDIVMQRTIDMMYQGQWRSLGRCRASADRRPSTALVEAFHEHHEREYNFRRDDAPVGLFRLNLKAVGVVPKAELAMHEPTGVTPEPRSAGAGLVRRRRRHRDAGLLAAPICRQVSAFKGPPSSSRSIPPS